MIVLVAVAALALWVGLWAIVTIYLYWQWFHYTRQSWGISQAYRRKAQDFVVERRGVSRLVFSLLPLWGILHRSHHAPATFLDLELRALPVPGVIVDGVAVAALAALGWWVLTRASAWRQGQLPVAHTLYLVSHFAVFFVGYILIEDIDTGWLVVNIWHNAQYIAFVWLANNNRFKLGIDPAARFLSTMSQERNLRWYLAVCFGISTLSYLAVDSLVAAVVTPTVLFSAVNFHHSIVDGLIGRTAASRRNRVLVSHLVSLFSG